MSASVGRLRTQRIMLDKFIRMIEAGVPKEAVLHDLKREGLHTPENMKFVREYTPLRNRTIPPRAQKQDNYMERIIRMIDHGVPKAAIFTKLEKDGLNTPENMNLVRGYTPVEDRDKYKTKKEFDDEVGRMTRLHRHSERLLREQIRRLDVDVTRLSVEMIHLRRELAVYKAQFGDLRLDDPERNPNA